MTDKLHHHFLEFRLLHLPVPDHHPRLRHQFIDQRRQRDNRLDTVVHEEDLALAPQLGLNGALDQALLKRRDAGLNGDAIFGRRLNYRHIPQSHQRHVQGARDGRRGHGEHVDILANLLQALLVRDAEPLLFIYNQQAQIVKYHVFG